MIEEHVSDNFMRLIQDQEIEIKALKVRVGSLEYDLRQTRLNLEAAHVDFRQLARQRLEEEKYEWEKHRGRAT